MVLRIAAAQIKQNPFTSPFNPRIFLSLYCDREAHFGCGCEHMQCCPLSAVIAHARARVKAVHQHARYVLIVER